MVHPIPSKFHIKLRHLCMVCSVWPTTTVCLGQFIDIWQKWNHIRIIPQIGLIIIVYNKIRLQFLRVASTQNMLFYSYWELLKIFFLLKVNYLIKTEVMLFLTYIFCAVDVHRVSYWDARTRNSKIVWNGGFLKWNSGQMIINWLLSLKKWSTFRGSKISW